MEEEEEMMEEEQMEEEMIEEEPDQVSFIPGGMISSTPQTFPYVEGGAPRQSLDFYEIEGLPQAKDGLRPAILFVHGGFWLFGPHCCHPVASLPG